MSSSSSSIFFETPPSSAKIPNEPRSTTDDDDDFVVEDSSSSSLEYSQDSSASIIESSSISNVSEHQKDDCQGKANDDVDGRDSGNLRESQTSSSTPVPSVKPGSMANTLDVTAMEPLHSNLNLTLGASAVKPLAKPLVNPVGTHKKSEKKHRRRVISFDDSSDEENVAPDRSYGSSGRKSNVSEREAPEVAAANSNYITARDLADQSTEDIDRDLNVFTTDDDDEVDNLAEGMNTVNIADEKESSSSKRNSSKGRRQRSEKDHMTLFAQPEPSSPTSDRISEVEEDSARTKATSESASKGFIFKQKAPAPEVFTLDSDSDPAPVVEDFEEEEQLQQRHKNRISTSSSSSAGNQRRQEQNSVGSSSSQAAGGATGSAKAFTFKQKEPVAAVFTIDSDSDSSVEIEADFGSLKISGEDKPKKAEPPKKTIFLSELPTSKPSQSVASSSRVPFSAYDDTTSLLAIDKCIKKLTLELENAPKETVERGPAPAKLNVELHPHQAYALEWLSWRENESPFGGILADEMGLGKTVMMLALICRSKEAASSSKDDGNGWRSSNERNLVESRATLVVCPASVMGQWEEECKSKASSLKVLLWHGSKRETSATRLAKYDMIVTSYNTVGSEIPKETEQLVCNSPLLKIKWKRVILDEGHIIRNPATTTAQAVCRLFSRHRWLVTGTPIHNKSSDFYSIIRFLHFEPFDDMRVWEQWIGMKFPNTRQTQRLQAIGKALLLRRTKLEIAAGPASHQKIPEKTVQDVFVAMKEDEREVYDHIQSSLREQFREMLKDLDRRTRELQNQANTFIAGKPRKPKAAEPVTSMAQMFVIILRCRQAAVLPRLVITMMDDEDDDDEEFDADLHLCSLKNPIFEASFVSAKLERLYEDLLTLRNEARSRGVPMDKAIIVSQWTTLLQIIDNHLGEKGFHTVCLTGKTPIPDRTDIMMKFNSNKRKPEIMLLSLTAGGCGLNLIGANHLFFMDIHWNPQLELQAQDRIHRFGQTKPVKITRYISEGTIEGRVLELQSHKLDLANSLLTGASVSKRSGAGLSIAEMRKLFDL